MAQTSGGTDRARTNTGRRTIADAKAAKRRLQEIYGPNDVVKPEQVSAKGFLGGIMHLFGVIRQE